MFSSLCLCCLISLTIFDGTPVLCIEDYEVQITITSLTRSDEPFLYIEPLCDDQNISQCRKFRCAAYSATNKTDIYWAFKTCPDERCDFKLKASNSIMDGLQASSNISLNKLESGILRCFANNSHGHFEDIQDVVPVNNTGQRFLNLMKQSIAYYEIIPESQEVIVIWTITVDGHPLPQLSLRPNNETISSFSRKYQYVNGGNQEINLTIANVTIEDLYTKYYLQAENDFENRIFNLTFNISGLNPNEMMINELTENYIVVTCSAKSILPCNITWLMKNCSNCTYNPVNESKLNTTNTDLECMSSLRIESSNSGFLRCDANNFFDSKTSYTEFKNVAGSVDIFSDRYLSDVDETTKRVEGEIAKTLQLICRVSAFNHTDEIQWTSPDLEHPINDSRIEIKKENMLFVYQSTITIPALGPDYEGKYFCKSRLKNGDIEHKAVVVQLGGTSKWPYYTIVFLVVIVIGISVFIGLKMSTYQRLQKEMKELSSVGLANFEKGALEHLNPNLTIDDQADLLPYDKRYEVPIEQLKLGEQIGSGAFGVVMKAEVSGIFENEPSTTVAVKMVNRTIGDIYIKALASELKIMIHLGKHVNIVNLLGACTKNITKRELLVIAEYCRFGNLKDYLLNQRHNFVDQINTETGKIDFSIGGDALGVNKPELTYVTPCFSNRFYEVTTTKPNLKGQGRKNTCPEASQTEDNCHYKGDYRNINKPVCTRDLLLWSFQVARGMEYLATRKVLHGDLAARNILLTDGNVVKICDFGLSKSMYQTDVYRKTGDEMLPVKWMAIEAITDKIFSVQSDVWSFGIALWELFSLARTPYPGMEYSESFCEKLLDGYRMKSPQYATEEIYDIMLYCWNADPSKRPSFGQLVHSLGDILDDKIKEHYIDMNTGYLTMNAKKFGEQNADYLAMVGAPDFKKFSSSCSYTNFVKSEDEVNTYI